ncbi:MAG: serine hydrolase, partial [Sedimentisphaerales bacterium]
MNKRVIRICLVVAVGFLPLSDLAAENQDVNNVRKTSVEEKIDQYIRSLPEPFSGTILLAVGDKILMNKGYGMADIGYGIPNTGKTKYQIASTTKHFTSVLVLQMAEKGIIDLNATIDTYLPDYPKDKASKITVHHLLLHQSGIPHHINGIDNYLDVQTRLFHTQNEYLKLFCDKKLVHEPGQGTTYSTPGYFLLGVILEKASSKSYAELLEENILKPLGMKDTFVGNNRTIHKDMATGYMKGLDGLVLANVEDMSNI